MKIPLLWRIERFVEKRKENNQNPTHRPIKSLRGNKKHLDYVTCPRCGNGKAWYRGSGYKCTRCGGRF